MSFFYVSIEKDSKTFDLYKTLWEKHCIAGIRVETMTEGIYTVKQIEQSDKKELCFVSIVADDIIFLPQLKILSEVTNAPILIATNNYTEDEHHEALNNGAAFYGRYSDIPEKNINAVLAVMNSINLRNRSQNAPDNLIVHEDILLYDLGHKAFFKGVEMHLSNIEMRFLRILMENRGIVLSYKKLYQYAYNEYEYEYDYDEQTLNAIYNVMKRLRKKLFNVLGNCYKLAGRNVAQPLFHVTRIDYIETKKNVGYRLKTINELSL